MIFKENMIVVITNGRLAGKKGVVLKALDDTHVLVAGVNRVPKSVEDHAAPWEKRKFAKFLTFIKKINVNHVLATRYKADMGLTAINCDDAVNDVKEKQLLNEKANKMMKDAYEASKSKWLFSALKF
ncbi:large subunit ribosomal protein L27e [Enteropsectra breve]|nr:large subunit ribosomal protein L27e [Enteropsectra breve]